ncbi:MAG: M14 family metallopeptidase [Woeseiaceae bacterium]
MCRYTLSLTLLLLLGGCATPITSYDVGQPCTASSFSVVDSFAGARRGRCRVLAGNEVELAIRPEDDGYVNPSPWFAFKLVAKADTTAIVSLRYLRSSHRYVPKISRDGLNWLPIDSRFVSTSDDGKTATLALPLGAGTTWIAAQELVTPPIYDVWTTRTAARTDAKRGLLGYSIGEQAIHYLVSNPDAEDVLLLVGRQHPPEVSGAFAMFSFLETLLADSELGVRFRNRFQVIAIPLLNPDGVIGGNWRHNLGGTDLNRDWGIFRQPETQLVGELLDKLDADGHRIRVFLDFHSTDRNVFYTQDASVPTDPPEFFEAWFSAAEPRLTNYRFRHSPGPGKRAGVGKNYMYRRYGIPSATYEVGDETDRTATRRAAAVFAEELMTLMLETFAQPR